MPVEGGDLPAEGGDLLELESPRNAVLYDCTLVEGFKALFLLGWFSGMLWVNVC
jgi:hypothetical protein